MEGAPRLEGRFFVRVEAADKAGNVGVSQTPDPLTLGGPPPTATIVDVGCEQEPHAVLAAEPRPPAGAAGGRPSAYIPARYVPAQADPGFPDVRLGRPVVAGGSPAFPGNAPGSPPS